MRNTFSDAKRGSRKGMSVKKSKCIDLGMTEHLPASMRVETWLLIRMGCSPLLQGDDGTNTATEPDW